MGESFLLSYYVFCHPRGAATIIAPALSSTAIAIQVMQELGLLSRQVGKSGFSVLLFQDIAVIPILALYSGIDPAARHVVEDVAHSGVSHGPTGWLFGLSVTGVFAAMIVFGRVALAPIFPIFTTALSARALKGAAIRKKP